MPRPEVVPFDRSHVPGAARLLAARHAAHRASEPLLPAAPDFEGQVAAELEDGSGAAALLAGEVVGYLVGRRREDPVGPHVWSGLAGHAAADPELVRDLYRTAAAGWVAGGLTRHFVFAPRQDELLDPWYRLSFGASAGLAIRSTAPSPAERPVAADVRIRRSEPSDLPAVARLAGVLETQLAAPPSFSGIPPLGEQGQREEWADTWSDERFVHFVAERGGRVVGHTLLYRRPAGDLRVPEGNIDLGNAATEPEAQGTGVGLAMTDHVLAWSREHGFSTMTTDWRMTNLSASRFWPRRGFREVFRRLYRSVP